MMLFEHHSVGKGNKSLEDCRNDRCEVQVAVGTSLGVGADSECVKV